MSAGWLCLVIVVSAVALLKWIGRWLDRGFIRANYKIIQPVLQAIGDDEISSYNIVERIRGINPLAFKNREGTILPLLIRLTDLKLLIRKMVVDREKKRKRFLYRVTDQGRHVTQEY